jgi:5-(carboxyamino)imidazole ribonucleotide synthase
MADTSLPLPPGSTIGILGGGQLGRMLSMAAARLGFRTHVYCPDPDSPAFQVTDRRTVAPYEDQAALADFAQAVDAVTYEFENIPSATAAALARTVRVEPSPSILDMTQDRYVEKSFISRNGLAVADFATVSGTAEIEAAAGRIGYPCILKTRRFGYDGKGQTRVERPADIPDAWSAIGGKPAILEAHVPFLREVSAIVARGSDGTLRSFDIAENRHENGILRSTTVPAGISAATAEAARAAGYRLAESLFYTGVVAVELFVVADGEDGERLLVNEIAPRVHNSGHWTEDACSISQFEMHMRAVANWPLPVPFRHSDVEMTNLLGNEVDNFAKIAALPDTRIHLYGKVGVRPGRKMGHINRLAPLRGR